MDWRSFVAGLIVGWLIELAIDWFYWRRGQAAPAAVSATSGGVELEEHRSQLRAAEARIQQLETDLATARDNRADDLAQARSQIENLQAELERLRADTAEHQSCVEKLAAARTEIERLQSEVARLQPVEPSDLKRIEGIGPKIEELLNNAGILTFQQLAAASIEQLQTILSEAGERYRLAEPSTWPEQARLAAEERWDELSQLQAGLRGGRQGKPPEKGGAAPL